MLARARAEREAQEAEDAQRRSDEVRAKTLQRLEAERQAELDKLSERMKARSRETGPAPGIASPAPPIAATPQAPERTDRAATVTEQRREPDVTPGDSGRVTVLLVMSPGDRGIRRFDKTSDPLLCTGNGCYVSGGAGSAAQFLPGRKAFGFFNTMGPRAGACSKSLLCIFRDVAFDSKAAFVQPVDMRLIRHDRREGRQFAGDSKCHLASGALDCRRTVIGPDYRIWIVPESLAREAGPSVLERALQEGLPEWRHAALAP
jgi:colicin import membrane protein